MGASLSSIKVGESSLPFIFEESRGLPIVSMQLVFQVSGSVDDGNLSGLANLSASILNEGSLKSGSEKFAEKVDEKAIYLSSGVGVETFVIRLDSLKESFGDGIQLLAELLESPNTKKDIFNRVKERIISQLLQKESNYDYVASRLLKQTIFKDTPLVSPKLGTVESIERIRLKDVKRFLAQHLVVERVIPVIGGDISEEEAQEFLQPILALLPHGENSQLPTIQFSENSEDIVEYRDTKQSYIYFASPFHMSFTDKDMFKMKVMFFILGSSGFGSRLMEEVRVKEGLAYSVYASGHVEKSYSYFSGHLQTKVENLQKAKDLVSEVISSFVKDGATAEELESAKKFILGSEPLRTETLAHRVSRAFKEYYRELPLGFSRDELELIRELKLSELNIFIKEHNEIINLTYSIVTAQEEKVEERRE